MKKKLLTAALTAALAMTMGITAFAGQWNSNSKGWWWTDDDGSNPAATWRWLDGNQDGIFECYYFGNDGYMLADTKTPDGYTVNSDGAWTVNGGVQLKYGSDETSSSTGSTDFSLLSTYDLMGVYSSESGDYFDINMGEGGALAAIRYNAEDEFQAIYSFAKVKDKQYKDSSKGLSITFTDSNSFVFNSKTYSR